VSFLCLELKTKQTSELEINPGEFPGTTFIVIHKSTPILSLFRWLSIDSDALVLVYLATKIFIPVFLKLDGAAILPYAITCD
jgi:hypothetical protein